MRSTVIRPAGDRRAAQPARADARRAPDDDADPRRARSGARTGDGRQRGSPAAGRAPGRTATTTVLDVESDVPLGVSSLSKYREHEFELPVGSTRRCSSTDGAVEVRGESVERGLERLRASRRRARPTSPTCATRSRAAMSAAGRRTTTSRCWPRAVEPLSDTLRTRWPANAETLARDATAAAPLAGALGRRAGRDLRHHGRGAGGVGERRRACVRSGHRVFEVEAEHAEGVITFVIRDRGQWRAPRGTHRGRGLAMMRALMEDGRRQPRRPRHGRGAAADARAARGVNPLARVDVEWHGDTPVAAIDGEVDASNIADVAAALRNLVTNRSDELVVDLSPTELPGQRRHQPDVRARRRAAVAPARRCGS